MHTFHPVPRSNNLSEKLLFAALVLAARSESQNYEGTHGACPDATLEEAEPHAERGDCVNYTAYPYSDSGIPVGRYLELHSVAITGKVIIDRPHPDLTASQLGYECGYEDQVWFNPTWDDLATVANYALLDSGESGDYTLKGYVISRIEDGISYLALRFS